MNSLLWEPRTYQQDSPGASTCVHLFFGAETASGRDANTADATAKSAMTTTTRLSMPCLYGRQTLAAS